MTSGLFALPIAPFAGPLPTGDYSAAPHAFMAGEENAVVRTLASAVTTQPLPFNPIVLCGPPGVGKSSVAHALVSLHYAACGTQRGVCASGLELAQAVADAADTADTENLRSQYLGCDWMLIDDVQGLAKRPAAQQFLLTAVNALVSRGVLVIAVLRQWPQATPSLLPRLVSRLSGGLVVELAPPGYEARCAIARQTADQANICLTDHDIQQLAHARGDLADRLLTAGKIRAAVFKHSTAARSTIANIPAPLDGNQSNDCTALCHTAATVVARHYGVPAGDLRRATRRKTVAAARAMAMYLVRALCDASYSVIGQNFGGRDHTTVLYACRKLAAKIETDAPLRRSVDDLAIQIAAECEL